MNKIKKCCRCKLEKELELFDTDNSRKDKRSAWCTECKRKWMKEYRKKFEGKIREQQKIYQFKWYNDNKERLKKNFKAYYEINKEAFKIRNKKSYFRRYGITYEEAMAMWIKQNKLCRICNTELLPLGTQLTKGFCVDHDHKTGKFRGILCHNCNAGIGMFKENIELIKLAVKYLEDTQL